MVEHHRMSTRWRLGNSEIGASPLNHIHRTGLLPSLQLGHVLLRRLVIHSRDSSLERRHCPRPRPNLPLCRFMWPLSTQHRFLHTSQVYTQHSKSLPFRTFEPWLFDGKNRNKHTYQLMLEIRWLGHELVTWLPWNRDVGRYQLCLPGSLKNSCTIACRTICFEKAPFRRRQLQPQLLC